MLTLNTLEVLEVYNLTRSELGILVVFFSELLDWESLIIYSQFNFLLHSCPDEDCSIAVECCVATTIQEDIT